jgi:oxaloacetate decarboxylase gamma subunit
MFVDGFKLMLTGMGMVFLFLTIMVILISWMAKILAPFAHLIEEPAPAAPAKKAVKNDDDVVAAIVAAVHKHRS